MINLRIEPTAKTPLIFCNAETGVLLIEGRSIPENSAEYFQPVYDWIDEYVISPNVKTDFQVKLEYFNTSSSKCILNILKKLENLHGSGKSSVEIHWFFEEDDEDMQEAGQDFDVIISIPFKMITINEFEKN